MLTPRVSGLGQMQFGVALQNLSEPLDRLAVSNSSQQTQWENLRVAVQPVQGPQPWHSTGMARTTFRTFFGANTALVQSVLPVQQPAHYSALQYITSQYGTVHYKTIQHSTVQCSTQYTIHSTQYTARSTQYSIHNTQHTANRTQYKVLNSQYTVHSTQYTVNSRH